MQSFSDEKLIEIFKNTNGSQRQKAFDCLYLRYSKPITQYFFFALHKDYEKARDFVHDLFIKVLESPEIFDTKLQFKPWIYRVATNMCKNEYRKANVVSKFNEYFLRTTRIYSDLSENEIRLNEIIKKLDHEQRSLIVLRFKINLSIKEIAEIFDCPEGTIKSRLFYLLKKLSEYYNK